MAERVRGASRRTTVLGSVVLGTGLLAVSAPVWVSAVGTSALSSSVAVTVTGGTAAPGVQAAGLVLLAAAAASLLVGRLGGWVVAGVVALGGVVALASSLPVLASPVGVARAAASSTTGVDVLLGEPQVAAVAWVAPVLGALALVLAAAAAAGTRGWRTGSRRHERGTTSRGSVPADAGHAPDLADLWDVPEDDGPEGYASEDDGPEAADGSTHSRP